MKYSYPQISSVGYRWNLLQRILNTIGIEPFALSDVAGETILEFNRDLTAAEKVQVDAIIANNPTLPPANSGSTFTIRDVWNQKDLIGTQMGFLYKVYYSESVPGSGNVDQIELHFSQILTTTQRNKIISEYGKLITLK